MERPVRPNPEILEFMKGKVSEKIEAPFYRLGQEPQMVETRLTMEGPGMLGLQDPLDNREWSGINNHWIKVRGAAILIGKLLYYNGHDVDVQLFDDTTTPSHAGRRQYDEAVRYHDAVGDDWQGKTRQGDTKITLKLLAQAGFDENLIRHVSQHAIGDTLLFGDATTWNLKLPIWLDYRISQNAMSLEQRFEQLHQQVPDRISQEYWQSIYDWARKTEKELFDALRLPSYEELVANPDHLRARVDVAIKLGRFTEEEEDIIKGSRLYSGRRSHKEGDLAEVLGATQEEFVDLLHLEPEDINDQLLAPERSERYLRRLYINDAEEGIVDMCREAFREDVSASAKMLFPPSRRGDPPSAILRNFPQNTWWGKYVMDLFEGDKLGYKSNKGKPGGIQRAIEFFRYLDDIASS